MPPIFTTLHGYFAWTGLALLVLLSLGPLWARQAASGPRGGLRGGDAAYGLVLLFTLLAFRWPGFFVQRSFSPDEAQFIAGARTLMDDAVFWRSVDGQTAGPLVYYALIPLAPFGLLNYTGARLIGCLMVFGVLWFSYRGLQSLVGGALARLCLLPAACLFAFSVNTEFVHYSSEHIPLLLMAIGINGMAAIVTREDASRFPVRDWLVPGMALGATAFSKLQAVPAAAVLLLTATLWLLTRNELPWSRRWGAVGKLAAAVGIVPLGFALMLTLGDSWKSFWYSYFLENFSYFQGGDEPLSTLLPFLMASRSWFLMAAGSVGIVILSVWKMDLRSSSGRWALVLVTAFAAASLPFTLFTRRHLHYQLLLIMPLVLLAAVTMASAWRASAEAMAAKSRRRILVGALGALVLAQIVARGFQGNWFLARMGGAQPTPDNISRTILQHAKPGDRLAIWGYRLEHYVETGLAQATSNANAASQLTPSPLQAYFVERYVSELQRSRPRFFVDSVGPSEAVISFWDRSRFAHEQYPSLAAFVANGYQLIGEVDHARIYLRKDS